LAGARRFASFVETESNSPSPTLVELIERAGGISATARSLDVGYLTVYGWARGCHRASDANLARLQALAATTPPDLARPLRLPRPPLRRRLPQSAEQLADVREAIRRAGGRTVAARALGVTITAVRTWDLGKCSPSGDRLQQLLSLPDGQSRRPGPPRRPRVANPAIFEEAVSVAGSISAAAQEFRVERVSVRRYLRREREVPADVLERAREFLAASGVTPDSRELPPS
jgi:hypothetical protein